MRTASRPRVALQLGHSGSYPITIRTGQLMDLGLRNKVVLITGGSKGLGLACAQAFALEGASVAIASRTDESLNQARSALESEGVKVFTVRADFSDPVAARHAVEATEAHFGPIDVLVNSAGAAKRFAWTELGPEAWHQGMDAKFYPYVNAIDAVRAGMVARGRGAIVNLIGMGGKFSSTTHLSGGAANAALMITTAAWASALGPHGIRVNAINPGPVMTERLQQNVTVTARAKNISEAEALKSLHQGVPLGRLGKPEEIAAAVVFLASDQASYITGALLPMDGGRHGSI